MTTNFTVSNTNHTESKQPQSMAEGLGGGGVEKYTFLTWFFPCVCSMFHCYWISQPLQHLKSGDHGDGSSRQTRLQRHRQFCKLSTKKQRDLQLFVRADMRNKTILTNFTGVLLLLYDAAALMCKKYLDMGVVAAVVCNVPIPMPLLHVSLLLDFTTAAAAEELRSRRQRHATSAAAAEAAL